MYICLFIDRINAMKYNILEYCPIKLHIMKTFTCLFSLLLCTSWATSQSIFSDSSKTANGDFIHFKNGVSLNCEVVEIAEQIVFYEQSPSKKLLSASLSEVSDIEMREQHDQNLSDSTKPNQVDPLYVQGMKDGKKYYRITHRGCLENLKNPRNALLTDPTYAAGYTVGAKKKKTWSWVLIGLFSPLYIMLILFLSAFWFLAFSGVL